MRCQVCGTDGQREGLTCRFCGATVRSLLGKGMPLPSSAADAVGEGREAGRERDLLRRRRRLVWHAAGGAMILFAAAVVVNVASFLLNPRHILLGIIRAVPVALVLGPPIGLITSWRDYGPVGGAVVGSILFAAGMYLSGAGSPLVCLLAGVVPGIAVGGLMGFHVRADRD